MTERPGTTQSHDFDGDVFDALTAAGWMFPETPAEVQQVEQELEQTPVHLPKHLANASSVFGRINRPPVNKDMTCPLQFPRDQEIAKGLARAARDGGDISQDLADRMRRDRLKAQEDENGQ